MAKGVLFALLSLLSGLLLVLTDLTVGQRAMVLAVCLWSSCRFYYFLFHVLHAWVDPALPSRGVLELIRKALRKGR